ncbi:MAG: C25 family cysteine peptidase, partial [Cyclobacteriaceae bacterium]
MKRAVSVLFFLIITFHAAGQSGNEWIGFGQPYFKVPVGSDGLYRIPHEALVQAGLAVFSADPRTFQLFHRGVEQAILVQGEGDGVFDSNDYIEFLGKRNDGTLDSTLYGNPDHQPHRYYNLFSDTTSYFLTYGAVTGKRITSFSGSSVGLIAEMYHRNVKTLILKESYSAGIDYGDVQQTTFDQGEGWMGVQIVQNQEVAYVLEGITETAAVGGKPLLEMLLTGRGPMVHQVDVSTGTRFLTSISFPGYQSHKHTQEIEWSDIDASGNLTLKIKVSGAAGSDRVSAGYFRLIYPQQMTMAGVSERSFLLGSNVAGFSFLRIQNAVAETRLFDVTSPDEVVEIAGVFTTALDAVAPASTERKIFATSEVKTPQRIRRVTFRNINPASHDYVIIAHPFLRKPSSGYVDPVKAYAEYRALPEGGGFDTLIVDIDQLYDQFNFGERSPRAIFQFLKFLASVKSPEYLFLIGKGLDVNYGYGRNPSAFTLYKDLVPTGGYPASDMAFTAGLSAVGGVPAVATGRLTAMAPSEVAAYFNKVKEREALPFDDLARKKILHLSGGIEESEPVMFRNILQDYAPVAQGLYFGAAVQAIGKQSTDVRLVNVAEEVNNGLGLITFFGHSAPNTTDFDIGMASDPVMGYNNKGKYPFLLMNGCDAGSFFLNAAIFGEDWIKTPEKGAVGFIAHSSYGRLLGLQRYASTFYNVAFGDSLYIKKGVGQVQKEVAKRYVENFGSSPASITQIQQMILLGDPAVKLFGAEKPDYSIDAEKISITPLDGEPVTAYSDSFLIRIPVRNFGIADEKNIRLQVTRQFNDQPLVAYDTVIAGILYSDTVSFVIRKKDDQGFGINVFTISLDADHFVDELNEGNNIAVFEYFIPLNSTRNLYPYEYSIVKTREVGLSFQYTDLQGAPREYLLEIDTASTFDSGFKKQFRISTTVLGKQQVELLSMDTLAYYWRTKIAEPLGPESKDWTVSS